MFPTPLFKRKPVGQILQCQNNQATKVDLYPSGRCYQQKHDRFEKVGKINKQGTLTLTNGQRVPLFETPRFVVLLNTFRGKWLNWLQQAKLAHAEQNDEIPRIRKQLTSKGHDGQGVRVTILEPSSGKEATSHAKGLAHLIGNTSQGIAPKTSIDFAYATPWNTKDPDKLLQLPITILEDATAQLKKLTARSKKPHVINMAYGVDAIGMGLVLYQHLQQKGPKQALLRQTIGIDKNETNPSKLYQSIFHYLEHTYLKQPQLQKAFERYQEATQEASKKGIAIVCSAGNVRDKRLENIPADVPLPKGSELNWFAKSPYIVSVAACDGNKEPGVYKNAFTLPCSSQGDGTQWNPTLSAPGHLPNHSDPKHKKAYYGTSPASAFTSATIALMRQKNLRLDVPTIQSILKESSTNPSNRPTEEVGAGILDIVKAVENTPKLSLLDIRS